MSKQINGDLVIARLLEEGEWWYALALFNDKQLTDVLEAMEITNVDCSDRTLVVYLLSNRLADSGKHIDTLRNFFNKNFLEPNGIQPHKSELWFNFGDCESLVQERLLSRTYDPKIDPKVHKDFVLDALTFDQLHSLYVINDEFPAEEDMNREHLLAKIQEMNFLEEYQTYLADADEHSDVKTEHGAIIEFLMGANIVEEEETNV